jgi:hypothetical protein
MKAEVPTRCARAGSYLRASKWHKETAISKLEDTLRWRRDYGLYSHVTAEHVTEEVRAPCLPPTFSPLVPLPTFTLVVCLRTPRYCDFIARPFHLSMLWP